jgi:NADPH:quinone reductase-like Zn-dependent oxidoreductase
MAAAKTVKQWTIHGEEIGFDELKLETVAFPECGENEVLVKLGAASLNYRDLVIPKVGSGVQKAILYQGNLLTQ